MLQTLKNTDDRKTTPGAKSGEYGGWWSSSKPAFRMAVRACNDVWAGACPGETAHRDATFLISTLSVPLGIFQSDQDSRFL